MSVSGRSMIGVLMPLMRSATWQSAMRSRRRIAVVTTGAAARASGHREVVTGRRRSRQYPDNGAGLEAFYYSRRSPGIRRPVFVR